MPDAPTGPTLGPVIDKMAALIPSLEPDLTLNVDDAGVVSDFGTGGVPIPPEQGIVGSAASQGTLPPGGWPCFS